MHFNETGESVPAPLPEHDQSGFGEQEKDERHERSVSACLDALAQQVKDMERRMRQEGAAVAPEELSTLLAGIVEARELALKEGENARRDALTGLPNLRAFNETMEIEMSRRARLQRQEGRGQEEAGHFSLHVVKIDLDFFKSINDGFGHSVGDLYLQKVSERLRAALRETDTVARIGGDEFVALLSGMDPAYAEEMKERLLEAVRQGSREAKAELLARRPHMKLEETEANVSASMGFARFNDGETPDALLERADYASYVAKAAGKDAVVDEAMLIGLDPTGEIRRAFTAEKEG